MDEKPTGAVGEPADASSAAQAEPAFEITTSRQFEAWMAEYNINLAFTTYQAGRLFFLGLGPDGRLSVFNRSLERCMGLAYAHDMLYVAGLYQIVKFVDAARALGKERFDYVITRLSRRLAGGRNMIAEVLEEITAQESDFFTEEEIDALRAVREGLTVHDGAPDGKATLDVESVPHAEDVND